MLHHRSQCRELPFLPFETPEIALLPITLTGNRLSTESPRRKSPQTELSLLIRCKVSAHPGSSLFIGEMAGNGTPRKTKRRINAPRAIITFATCHSPNGELTAREARKSRCSDVSSPIRSTRPSDFTNVSL
ncbi:unnamed protein product [Prunus armeniaca]